VDAGVNHPGVLAGLHSRTLDGQHTQQWVVDDAPASCAPGWPPRTPAANSAWAI
jgi:hypothetical protein